MPTQKALITDLLKALGTVERQQIGKFRRSSLSLDTSELISWFGTDRPLHGFIKDNGHRNDADMKKLFDEVEFCRTNNVDFARKVLAGLMLKYPALLAKYAARSVKVGAEEFRYYHHAQMVLNQFLDYFLADDDPGGGLMSNELMIWMILFHDMDKVLSIETFGNDGEHDATVEAMKEFAALDSGFTDLEVALAWRMVSVDPLGEYFKGANELLGALEKGNKIVLKQLGRPPFSLMPDTFPAKVKLMDKLQKPTEEQLRLDGELIHHAALQMIETAALAGVKGAFKNLPAWFHRYMQFYQCDFSSYHVDSKYGDECFFDEVSKSGARISGPDSFNPNFFGDAEVHTGDDKALLIPVKPCVGRGHRLEFRRAVYEKHAVALIEAFSTERLPSKLPADAFTILKSIRANLVSQRKQMSLRTSKTACIDFRKVFAQDELQASAARKIMTGVEPPLEDDVVLDQFDNDGLYIRKLVAIPKDKTPREDLEGSEFWKVSEKVIKESITPWVLPSTLVLKGIPTNLTNAGVELLHCSGLIYDKDTPMAPSTKEHSESAQLSTTLKDTIQKRIKLGFGHSKWLGIVRATIEVKGGKSYEDRPTLVKKLREMELRRSGKSPDLSTKELLYKVLLESGRPILSKGSLASVLKFWEHAHNGDEPLPPLIEDQIRAKYEKVLTELGPEKWIELRHVLGKLKKTRTKRDHTIYDGSDRGIATGNRYFVSDKGEQLELGSSEAAGYDGYTFKTNEVLLLPDGYHRIIGIYCNTYSVASLIHALTLALELHVQLDSLFGLYTYSATKGMERVTASEVIEEIMKRMKLGETIEPKKAVKDKDEVVVVKKVVDEPKAQDSLDIQKAKVVMNDWLESQAVYFPPTTGPRD